MPKILFVDDEPAILRALDKAIRSGDLPWECTFVAHSPDAAGLLEDGAWDVLVTDIDMPGIDGIELARRGRAANPELACVALTGSSPKNVLDRAYGIIDVLLIKPCRMEDLIQAVEQVFRGRESQ